MISMKTIYLKGTQTRISQATDTVYTGCPKNVCTAVSFPGAINCKWKVVNFLSQKMYLEILMEVRGGNKNNVARGFRQIHPRDLQLIG